MKAVDARWKRFGPSIKRYIQTTGDATTMGGKRQDNKQLEDLKQDNKRMENSKRETRVG